LDFRPLEYATRLEFRPIPYFSRRASGLLSVARRARRDDVFAPGILGCVTRIAGSVQRDGTLNG